MQPQSFLSSATPSSVLDSAYTGSIGGMENTVLSGTDVILLHAGSVSDAVTADMRNSSSSGIYSVPRMPISDNHSSVVRVLEVERAPSPGSVLIVNPSNGNSGIACRTAVEQGFTAIPVTIRTNVSSSCPASDIEIQQELIELASAGAVSKDVSNIPVTNPAISELLSLMGNREQVISQTRSTIETNFREPAIAHHNWNVTSAPISNDDDLFAYYRAKSDGFDSSYQRGNNCATYKTSSRAHHSNANNARQMIGSYNSCSLCRFLFGLLFLLAGIAMLIFCAIDTASVHRASSLSANTNANASTVSTLYHIPVQTGSSAQINSGHASDSHITVHVKPVHMNNNGDGFYYDESDEEEEEEDDDYEFIVQKNKKRSNGSPSKVPLYRTHPSL